MASSTSGAEGGASQWLTDGHEKYIWFTQTGRELLFDLDEVPTELRDLVSARPEQVALWRGRLMDELTGREEGFVQDGHWLWGDRKAPHWYTWGGIKQDS